jgi:hypothetical protein
MIERSEPASALRLFGYALIFPAVWWCFGTLLSLLSPGKRLGTGGLVFVVMVTALATGWLFARNRHRAFLGRERWFLIGYCAVWAVLFELSGLLYAVSLGLFPNAQPRSLVFAALFAAVVDTLFLWLGFKYTGMRFIKWYLEKYPAHESA